MATFWTHALYPHYAPQSHWSPSVISVKLEDLSNKQEKTLFLCHITCQLTSIHSLELVKTWRRVEGLRAKSKGVSTPFFASHILPPASGKERGCLEQKVFLNMLSSLPQAPKENKQTNKRNLSYCPVLRTGGKGRGLSLAWGMPSIHKKEFASHESCQTPVFSEHTR